AIADHASASTVKYTVLCGKNQDPGMLIAEVAPWTAAWAIQRIGGRARAKAARRAVLAAARPAPRATVRAVARPAARAPSRQAVGVAARPAARATVRAVARPAVRTALQASARETARATASSDAPAHGRRTPGLSPTVRTETCRTRQFPTPSGPVRSRATTPTTQHARPTHRRGPHSRPRPRSASWPLPRA